MTTIIGIDPGPETSGYAVIETGTYNPPRVLHTWDDLTIAGVVGALRALTVRPIVAVEDVSSRGRFAGPDVVNTAKILGQIQRVLIDRAFRYEIVHPSTWRATICGNAGAKPAQIKACIREIYAPVATGGGADRYKGTKTKPGPLHAVAGGHAWDALGVALHAWRQGGKP